ncbi:MAG: 4'-phosphopantetheinyl transferase superfamily protein [Polyangiaceae bacterium]
MVAPKEILRRETAHGRLVAVAVDEACTVESLLPEERAIAETRAELVRPAFVAGRRALRAALGVPAVAPIVHDDRGAPTLPEGWVGSISHKATVALAVARRADGARVGVDVELPRPGRIDISRRVLTDEELAEVQGAEEGARSAFTLRRFSMKEAIYKAIDPFLRRYVGFREVRLDEVDHAYAVRFVAPRAGEPALDVSARIDLVDTELGPILVSTALARLAGA